MHIIVIKGYEYPRRGFCTLGHSFIILVMYACVVFIRVCIKYCMCMLALERSIFLFGELTCGIQEEKKKEEEEDNIDFC